jgi:hypothetical protein
MLWLEELGKLKKSNDLIGIRNCNLTACGIVPQPNKLSHSSVQLCYKQQGNGFDTR